MRGRLGSFIGLTMLLVAGALPVQASSTPSIQGRVAAIELCAQFQCGAAIFVGVFTGQVNGAPALGTVAVAVTHDDLPEPGDPPAAIHNGGLWAIQLLSGRKFSGAVTGGSLVAHPDNTFTVSVDMAVSGGGTLHFGGILNHNTFPPTLTGLIAP
jgi:hypothetical protein